MLSYIQFAVLYGMDSNLGGSFTSVQRGIITPTANKKNVASAESVHRYEACGIFDAGI